MCGCIYKFNNNAIPSTAKFRQPLLRCHEARAPTVNDSHFCLVQKLLQRVEFSSCIGDAKAGSYATSVSPQLLLAPCNQEGKRRREQRHKIKSTIIDQVLQLRPFTRRNHNDAVVWRKSRRQLNVLRNRVKQSRIIDPMDHCSRNQLYPIKTLKLNYAVATNYHHANCVPFRC